MSAREVVAVVAGVAVTKECGAATCLRPGQPCHRPGTGPDGRCKVHRGQPTAQTVMRCRCGHKVFARPGDSCPRCKAPLGLRAEREADHAG